MRTDASPVSEILWKPGAHCLALDGVRGLAILLVTVYRFGHELDPTAHPAVAIFHRVVPAGQYGVDLFFVLSGFLITSILLGTKGQPHYYRNFMAKRALRIFPLYFLSLIVGILILPQLWPHEKFLLAREEQFYLWTYTSNLRMSWLNSWCFGPFDHFWSLAVEEHFYFVWPLVVWLLTRAQLLRLCIALITIILLARTIAATSASMQVAVETLTIFRIDALCMGAAVALLVTEPFRDPRLRNQALVFMSCLLLILVLKFVVGKKVLGLPGTFCPAFFAAGMLVLLLGRDGSLLAKIFELRGLTYLGQISYGMYVIQLPLVTLLPPQSVVNLLPGEPLLDALVYLVGMFTATTVFAVVSYYCFERPFLKMKQAFK